MARRFPIFFFLLGLLPALAGAAPNSFKFGRFGTIPIVRPAGEPSKVALLFSGEKGLGEREAAIAKALAASGALVFEVDTARYYATAGHGGGRLFPAVDFEALSQIGQKESGLQAYRQPILVGTGAGASLIYVALAEAPADTFAGVISDGFCAVISSDRLFRRAAGLAWDRKWAGPGVLLLPTHEIEDPWLVLDVPGAACAGGSPKEFVKKINSARIIPAPPGVAPGEAWKKQLPQALAILAAERRKDDAKIEARGALKDLPLIEVPAKGAEKDVLAVVLTGSGGYVGFDRQIGSQLAQRGVRVVGLSSIGYFWKPRQPDGSGRDLARILEYYLTKWHKSRAIIVGYSQGADVAPFMISRLPPPLRSRIALVAMVGLDGGAQFDMHPDGWISDRPLTPEFPVAPELPKLKGTRALCIYGEEEKKSLCKSVPPGIGIVEVPGGHGFEGEAAKLAERFIAEVGAGSKRAP